MDTLHAISPIDGRYRSNCEILSNYFSEFALFKYRTRVEIEYWIAVCQAHGGKGNAELARDIYRQFNIDDAKAIKAIEHTTKHDVKALEYWLRERAAETGFRVELIHFGLTSEDINCTAYALMIKDALKDVFAPVFVHLLTALRDKIKLSIYDCMLSRTHGQPATPTTMGKELAVFIERLNRQLAVLYRIRLTTKISGAVGTYAAMNEASPQINWPKLTDTIIHQFDLEPNWPTTQIDPHDSLVEVFDCIRHINNILINFDQDIWRYISDDYFTQRAIYSEIGSSTMPHKINPIDFENSEGNLGFANAMLCHFSEKLTKSRLQRDLSDSTVIRNFGLALAHSLIAYQATIRGLGKIFTNKVKMTAEVDAHPEILAEAIQTILRSAGIKNGYELLKDFSRGSKLSKEDFRHFIGTLPIDSDTKIRMLELSPTKYIGSCAALVELALVKTEDTLQMLRTIGD